MAGTYNPLPETQLQPPRGFVKNVSAGGNAAQRTIRSAGHGLAAAAGALVGADDFAEQQILRTQQIQEEQNSQNTPRITDITQAQNLEDAVDYLGGLVGQQLPIMATLVAGGPTALGARALALRMGAKAVPSKVATAAAGLGGASAGFETGLIMPEVHHESNKPGSKNLTLREQALVSLGGGVGAGAFETLPYFNIASKLGLGKTARRSIKRNILSSIAKGGGEQALIEGGTEGIQTIIERGARKFANDNFEIFGSEGRNELINAIAGGAIIGGGLGSATAGLNAILPGGTEQSAGNELSTLFPEGTEPSLIEDIEAEDELKEYRRNNFEGETGVRASSGLRDFVDNELKPGLDLSPYEKRELLKTIRGIAQGRVTADNSSRESKQKFVEFEETIKSLFKSPDNFNEILLKAKDPNTGRTALQDSFTEALEAKAAEEAAAKESFDDTNLDDESETFNTDTGAPTYSSISYPTKEVEVTRSRLNRHTGEQETRTETIQVFDAKMKKELEAFVDDYPRNDDDKITKGLSALKAAEELEGQYNEPHSFSSSLQQRRNKQGNPASLYDGVVSKLKENGITHPLEIEEKAYRAAETRLEAVIAGFKGGRAGEKAARLRRVFEKFLGKEGYEGFVRDKKAIQQELLDFNEKKAYFTESINRLAKSVNSGTSTDVAADISNIELFTAAKAETETKLVELRKKLADKDPKKFFDLFVIEQQSSRPNAISASVEKVDLYGKKPVVIRSVNFDGEKKIFGDEAFEIDKGNGINLRRLVTKSAAAINKDGKKIDGEKDLSNLSDEDISQAITVGISALIDEDIAGLASGASIEEFINNIPLETIVAYRKDRYGNSVPVRYGEVLEKDPVLKTELAAETTRRAIAKNTAAMMHEIPNNKKLNSRAKRNAALTKKSRENTRLRKVLEKHEDKLEKAKATNASLALADSLNHRIRTNEIEGNVPSDADYSDEFKIDPDLGRGQFGDVYAPVTKENPNPPLLKTAEESFEKYQNNVAKGDDIVDGYVTGKTRVDEHIKGIQSSPEPIRTSLAPLEYSSLGKNPDSGSKEALEFERLRQALKQKGVAVKDAAPKSEALKEKEIQDQSYEEWKDTWVNPIKTWEGHSTKNEYPKLKEGSPVGIPAPKQEFYYRPKTKIVSKGRTTARYEDGELIPSIEIVRRAKPRSSAEVSDRLNGISNAIADNVAQDVVNKWAKEMNVEVPSVVSATFKGTARGKSFSGENVIALNSTLLNPEARLSTLAHEFGHILLNQHLAQYSNAQLTTVYKEFMQWREAQIKSNPTVAELNRSKKTFDAAVDLLTDPFSDTRISALNKHQLEYVLDFHEWFADQTSRYLTRKNTGDGFFQALARTLRKFYDMIRGRDYSTARSVTDFLDGVMNRERTTMIDRFIDTSAAAVKFPKDLLAQKPAEVWYSAVVNTQNPFSENSARGFVKILKKEIDPETLGLLAKVINKKGVKRKLYALLENDPQLIIRAENSEYSKIAYAYQAHVAGMLTLNPEAHKTMQSIYDYIQDLTGVIQDHVQAETLFQKIHSRKIGASEYKLEENIRKTVMQRGSQSINKAYGKFKPYAEALINTADARMHGTGNPHLIKIANLISARTSENENVAETMFEGRTHYAGRYVNKWHNAFNEATAAEAKEALELLQNTDKFRRTSDGSRPKQLAKAARRVLREVREYANAKNVNIRDKGASYFPWVFEQKYMQGHMDEFMTLISQKKYIPPLQAVADKSNAHRLGQINLQRREEGLPSLTKLPKGTETTIEQVKGEIVSSIAGSDGLADINTNSNIFGDTPYMSALNERSLQWITDLGNKADRETLAKFFDKNLDHTMTVYIHQAVKRAEYVSRFGTNGQHLKTLLSDAIAFGATSKDIKIAEQYMDAALGKAGQDSNAKIQSLLGRPTIPGQVIDPKFQTFNSVMIITQNLALLSLATFTSLVDPVGIAVRGGSYREPLAALKVGAAEIIAKTKGERSELRKMAEAMGTIEDKLTNEALSWEYETTWLSPRLRWVNDKFFDIIQLTRWTRFTRLMALGGAESFLKSHMAMDNVTSKRYMQELGLKAGDVKLKDGKVSLLTSIERDSSADPRELARDDRIRAALNRFVDESILRPNAALRPIWASDPHFSLVFHLKSFMYTFHERIIRRAVNELEEGQAGPMLMMMMFIPVMLMADLLRDAFTSLLGKDLSYKDNWTMGDYAINAAERSGVTGLFSMLFEARQDIRYGGIGIESFLGPTSQSLVLDNGNFKPDDLFFNNDQGAWKVIRDNLPLQNSVLSSLPKTLDGFFISEGLNE